MSQIELKSCTASAKQSCAGLAQIPTGDEFQVIMLQEIGEEKVECWTLCCKVFVWVVVVRCSCVHERNETILFIITYVVYNKVCTTLQSMMNANQSAKVLTLLLKWAHQDDSNNTPQPICECQVAFPLLWIKDYPGLS